MHALTGRIARIACALPILLMSIVIMLPVPLGNFAPALALIFIAVGFTARDGLAVLGGLAASLLALGWIFFLLLYGAAALEWQSRVGHCKSRTFESWTCHPLELLATLAAATLCRRALDNRHSLMWRRIGLRVVDHRIAPQNRSRPASSGCARSRHRLNNGGVAPYTHCWIRAPLAAASRDVGSFICSLYMQAPGGCDPDGQSHLSQII